MSFSFRSPSSWVSLATFLAAVGLILGSIGMAAHIPWLRLTGAVLMAPIFVGGILLLVVVIPIVIALNYREKRRENRETRE